MSTASFSMVMPWLVLLLVAMQPAPTAAPQPAVDGALKSASPKSPQDAQAGIQVPAGFRVDLVAVEPQVLDPVAFAWGPDGRLWVAEMADYPLGKGAKGRVRCLKDTNGDGRYNHGTVFLDGLNFPTSVLPWRDGVLVTAAPQIIFARDTNGDGRADQQHVLFQGFGEGNQQHRVNGLCFTLDNWVAVANGDSGGTIGSTKTGLNVEISGRDLLIQPDTGGLIPRSGMSQFGHTRDDWGNWFGCNNPNPIYHFVLEDKYLLRNPYLKPPSPRREIIVGRRRVVPLSEVINHCSVRQGYPGRISSACGVTIYRDELLCSEYLNNSFTAEPYHNLVHRRVLKSEGVTFASHRAENEREAEFFRSDDPWCRPTYVQTGPDGALYIADMYRQVIEHPEWIDDQLEKKLDLGAGRDRGRIWRVAPAGSKPRPFPRLDRMSNSQLVASLDSPGAWQRDMAQQMIVWQADKAAIKPLLDLIGSCKRPQARLQAMYALEGLRALPDKVVVTLLSDTHPGVRRHAIRVAEVRLADTPSFGPALLKLINDHDPHVRLQLAYSLGAWDDERAAKALAQLAVRNQSDPYLTAAVFSSLNQSNIAGVLAAVLHGANGEATGELLAAFYGQVAALADRSLLDDAIGEISRPRGGNKILAWQLVALADVLDRLVSRTIELRTLASPPIRLQVNAVFDEARRIVGDHAAGAQDVLSAMRLLRHSGATRTGAALTSDLALLRQRVSPQQTIAIQLAAVDALGRVDGPSIPGLLLEGWSGQTPQIRRAILRAVVGREDWIPTLFDHVANKNIHPFGIDPGTRNNLINHHQPALAKRAAQLFNVQNASTREVMLQKYSAALSITGDISTGRVLFRKHCSACHQLETFGQRVGPDLTVITDRSPKALLIAILDPNRAVEDKYLSFGVATTDGRVTSGMLTAETSASVTLRTVDGREQVILRSDIDALYGTGKSLMPEGLERELNDQGLADIIEYVQAQIAVGEN